MKETITTYIGPYPIEESKLLRRELCRKVKGLGLINSVVLLSKLGYSGYNIRDLCLKDLSESKKEELSKLLSLPYIIIDDYVSNRKFVPITEDYKAQIFYQPGNILFIGDFVKSQEELSKKRLIKQKCYIGNRLKLKQKVHGQRTKSTGRKTKAMKGFQKKKKLQREVEKK